MKEKAESSDRRWWLWLSIAGLLLLILWLGFGWRSSEPQSREVEQNAVATAPTVDEAAAGGEPLAATPATALASSSPIGEGGRVFGQILLAQNREPVPFAKVYLKWAPNRMNRTKAENMTVESGSDGQFRFDDVAWARYQLMAERDELLSFQHRGETVNVAVDTEQPEQGPYTLLLYKVPLLEVEVVSAVDGMPIEGAAIPNPWHTEATHRTNIQGIATLALTNQIWSIQISAKGYAKAMRAVQVNKEGVTRLRVALEPGGSIYGVVADDAGEPLNNLAIQYSFNQQYYRVTSDENGHYEIEGLPLGTGIMIVINELNYDRYMKQGLVLENEAGLKHDIVLAKTDKEKYPDFTLSGIVLDETDVPIEGAAIAFGPGYFSGGTNQTTSDAAGLFRLTCRPLRFNIQGGNLLVSASGYAPTVTLIKQEDREDFIVKLSRGHWIKGRLVDAWGSPVPDATVLVSMDSSYFRLDSLETQSNENGEFELNALPEKARFSFFKQGYAPINRKTLELNRDDIEVVMTGQGVIHGRVFDAESKEPVPAFKISLFMGSSPFHFLPADIPGRPSATGIDFMDSGGYFRIEGVSSSSEIRLQVDAESYNPKDIQKVKVYTDTEGEPLEIPLSQDGLLIQGLVVGPDGNPWPNASVSLFLLHRKSGAHDFMEWRELEQGTQREIVEKYTVRTAADGVFRFENVPEDFPMNLTVTGEGMARQVVKNLEDFTKEKLEDLLVKVALESEIFGRVNMELYPNAEHVRLLSFRPKPMLINAPIVEGGYAVKQLPAGPYQLELGYPSLESQEHAVKKGPVELPAAESLQVDFGFETYTLSGNVFINDRPMVNGTILLKSAQLGQVNRPPATTDGNGYFRFDNLENGEYSVIAVNKPGLDIRTAREYMSRHANTEGVTLDGADLHRQFHFRVLGSLRGRLTPAPKQLTSLGLTEPMSGFYVPSVGSARSAGMLPDGTFEFDEVSPGEYSLYLGRNFSGRSHSRLLIPSVHMPDDGSDVDLGDIPLDDSGSLQILLEGMIPEGYLGVFADIKQRFPEGGVGPRLVTVQEYAAKEEILINELPAGSVRCELRLGKAALKLVPPFQDLEIIPDETQVAVFTIQGITELTVRPASNETNLQWVSMSRSEDGPRINFQETTVAPHILRGDYPFDGGGYLTPKFAIAREFGVGVWHVAAGDDKGGTWTATIDAKLGTAIELAADFE